MGEGVAKTHARQARHDNLLAVAQESFKDHQIVAREARRWVIQAPSARGGYRQAYWTEVVVLDGGKLLVHGDVEHVIFAAYSDDRQPENVLRWMGRHADFAYYVKQKAEIGTGRALIEATDGDAAADDLRERMAELRAEAAEASVEAGGSRHEPLDPETAAELATLEEALEMLTGWSEPVEGVRRWLYDNLAQPDAEWICTVGRVVDARLYFAHAALRRLCALLDAERARPAGEAEAT